MSTLDNDNRVRLSAAVSDFHQARQKARMERLLALLRGRSVDLLSYDMVRQKFRTIESARRILEDIPIEKIQGSVGRYTDFSRTFLPRHESDAQRWAQVRMGVESLEGLPPIEAYKVGDVYFILDGHHRVSVAREMGFKTIEGYVIPVHTRVPLSPGDRPDDLIIKSEYDDFLNDTNLDELRPGADLLVTAPGQYQKLREHIAVHQYFMGEKRGHAVPLPEAAADWYDTVYLPVVNLIRERNLLRDFPNRTETDLYLWIMDHRAALSGGDLGWEVRAERAVNDLVQRYSHRRVLPRVARKIASLLIPNPLESGPPPGTWRGERPAAQLAPHRDDHLFDDILVAVPGGSESGPEVRMAVEVARREEARLTGLHIVADESERESEGVQAVRQEFARRCAESGVAGRMLVQASKDVSALVSERSHWVDLVVFRLNYPPPTRPWQRLRSGARMIIRRSSAPIFAVPDAPFRIDSALLAYGPGRKAEEALYLATYLAGRWQIPLTVLTVQPKTGSNGGPSLLERARQYIEASGVNAAYHEEAGENHDPANAILINAEQHGADFIIMGGYESGPLRESVFGSTVDAVLRSTRRPVLICN